MSDQPDEVLKRQGSSRESVARLARKAAEAEQMIGIHGVSVSAGTPYDPFRQAEGSEVERQFRVHDTPTRSDPLHRTIELPKPVTAEVAAAFSQLFRGRK